MASRRRPGPALWAAALAACLGGACGEPEACEVNADGAPFAADPWVQAALRAAPGDDANAVLRAERMLEVSGLPAGWAAFNPSLVRHRGRLVGAFRVEARGGEVPMHNRIVMAALDDDLQVVRPLSWLETGGPAGHPGVAEDPRLFVHRDSIWLIYNASDTPRVMGPRTLHIARVVGAPAASGRTFALAGDRRLIFAGPGGRAPRISKNWSPFVHDQTLHLIYQSSPLEVVRVPNAELAGEAPLVRCEPVSSDPDALPWRYGQPRGGTPALYEPLLGRFVTFFHSRRRCRSQRGEPTYQYLTGMYTFSGAPPFTVDAMLPHPLVTPSFLEDLAQPGSTIAFAGGLVLDEAHAQVSFGRNDARAGVMVLDKRRLFRGLVPVAEVRAGRPAADLSAPAAAGGGGLSGSGRGAGD